MSRGNGAAAKRIDSWMVAFKVAVVDTQVVAHLSMLQWRDLFVVAAAKSISIFRYCVRGQFAESAAGTKERS